MRFVLPLLALGALVSAPLRADMFDITISGTLSGSGTFSTDGICSTCTPSMGLLSLTINIGPDSGPDAFDIRDDLLGPTFYIRPTDDLMYVGNNSETASHLSLGFNNWILTGPGVATATGCYSITPSVPEPRSLFLLLPIVALVGLRWRHQRHRAEQ